MDLVVISHPHADHFAGLLEALESLEVATFVDRTEVVAPAGAPAGVPGRGGEEAGQYLQFRKRLAAAGSRMLQASPGSSLALDGVRIVFFGPARPLLLLDGGDPWSGRGGPPSGDELNGGSLVALLSVREAEVLLPGDAEADVLDTYDLPKLSAIVVRHHGSRGAVSQRLLAALRWQAGADLGR